MTSKGKKELKCTIYKPTLHRTNLKVYYPFKVEYNIFFKLSLVGEILLNYEFSKTDLKVTKIKPGENHFDNNNFLEL